VPQRNPTFLLVVLKTTELTSANAGATVSQQPTARITSRELPCDMTPPTASKGSTQDPDQGQVNSCFDSASEKSKCLIGRECPPRAVIALVAVGAASRRPIPVGLPALESPGTDSRQKGRTPTLPRVEAERATPFVPGKITGGTRVEPLPQPPAPHPGDLQDASSRVAGVAGRRSLPRSQRT